LGIVGFRGHSIPEDVVFLEAVLNDIGWECIMDVGLVAAMITCVDGNPLPKVLLDRWDEWAAQTSKTSEGKIGGSKATRQWTAVVALRSWNLLHVDLMLPEIMRNQGLSNTIGIQCSIFPACCGISVYFTPVAVPARRSIVSLSGSKSVRLRLEIFKGYYTIVPAFSVSANPEQFVLDISRSFLLQAKDLTLKLLPLRKSLGRIA